MPGRRAPLTACPIKSCYILSPRFTQGRLYTYTSVVYETISKILANTAPDCKCVKLVHDILIHISLSVNIQTLVNLKKIVHRPTLEAGDAF